ncbi:MAG: hypothetical protein IRY83_17290 [Chloroflexi bacterium]|nr:hypothetical protein [Chloroflexota bacterium]
MSNDVWSALAGLATGLALGGLGLWLGLRAARRHRAVDERLRHIKQKALTKAWGLTSVALGAAFIWLAVAPERPSPLALWGALYLVHIAGGAVMFVIEAARS